MLAKFFLLMVISSIVNAQCGAVSNLTQLQNTAKQLKKTVKPVVKIKKLDSQPVIKLLKS